MARPLREKVKEFLEWLEHAYFVGFILIALGAGRAVNALLITFTGMPELWRTPIWLLSAGLVMTCLVALGNHFRRQRVEAGPPQLQSDPPPPLPPARPQTVAAKKVEERVFVDVTPEYLAGFFKGHTNIQGQRLFSPYRGKWMERSGHLGEVQHVQLTELLQVSFQELVGGVTMSMFFSTRWTDHFSVMKPGDPLTVQGRIDNAGANIVSLQDCELVSHGPHSSPIVQT